MRVFIVVSALLSSGALAQYIDPLVGLLAPQASQPNLYTIRGPIYVEPASLQPPLLTSSPYGPQPGYAVGPAVVGPPIVGPPIVGPGILNPTPIYGQSVISPSPYNPYAPGYPVQMLYDEQQDEVSPPLRRSGNSNVQMGVQQYGQGNMNLQGNIQQVNRRSILGDQKQSDQMHDEIYSRNPRGDLHDSILESRQHALQDQIARSYQNDPSSTLGRKNPLQDQLLRSQLQNDPSLALRQQNLLNDPLAVRQNTLQDQLLRNQLLNDPSLAYRQQNALNDPLLGRQNSLQDQLLRNQLLNDPSLAYRQQNALNDPLLGRQQSLNDLLIRNQLQNDPLSLIRQQAANDQLRLRNDLELKDQLNGLGPVQSDPRNVIGGRGSQSWRQAQPGQIQNAGRWNGRLNPGRRGPGFQIQGQGIQSQFPGNVMDVFSDLPQRDALASGALRAQKGFQNDAKLFDESLLMNDELNDELNDALPRQQLLDDALNSELADAINNGFA